MLSPGVLRLSKWKSESIGPQQRARGSACVQSPWDANVVHVPWCGQGQPRRGRRWDLGSRKLESTLPNASGRVFAQKDGMGSCRTTWAKEVSCSTFPGSFVSSELFSAGVVYIQSELTDPLCSRRYRKQARQGGAPTLPATCLQLNGPSVRPWSGRAARRPGA